MAEVPGQWAHLSTGKRRAQSQITAETMFLGPLGVRGRKVHSWMADAFGF